MEWNFKRGKMRCHLNTDKVLESDEKTCATFLSKQPRANKPDVVVYTKANKEVLIIDPACAFDTRIEEKV